MRKYTSSEGSPWIPSKEEVEEFRKVADNLDSLRKAASESSRESKDTLDTDSE